MPWNKDGSRKSSAFYKMKGSPMKRNFGIPSPLKDDEWIDTVDDRRINMHQGDPKIKRGEKGHVHSTSYLAAARPPKLEKKKAPKEK